MTDRQATPTIPAEARVSLEHQAACARRELALRKAAYPTFVLNHKMTEAEASLELTRMAAIVDTLEDLCQPRLDLDGGL